MKNKELIELLKQYPKDIEIFMSSDPEGNHFSPISDMPGSGRFKLDDYDNPIIFDNEPYDIEALILYPED